MGYILACIRDISEIIALHRGFSGSSYRMMLNFTTTDPVCHGNEI